MKSRGKVETIIALSRIKIFEFEKIGSDVLLEFEKIGSDIVKRCFMWRPEKIEEWSVYTFRRFGSSFFKSKNDVWNRSWEDAAKGGGLRCAHPPYGCSFLQSRGYLPEPA
jgi:hypothetical protein